MKTANQTNLTDFDSWSTNLSYDTLYVDCGPRQFSIHVLGGGSIHLVDVTNAAKRGKKCTVVRVDVPWETRQETNAQCVFFNSIRLHNWNIERLFDAIVADPSGHGASIDQKDAIRTYSPYSKPLPLKATPKKWTVELAIRALMNGQFEGLRCNGVYTDDYAYDAASNFNRGEIQNAEAFAARVMSCPSGWRVWPNSDGSILHLNCHSFDSNEFKPRI